MNVQGANLFFQLITKRYEKNTTIFTSNKPFSQWNEVFSDMTVLAAAILDRVFHHCNVINIRGGSYRLKERKEHMQTPKKVCIFQMPFSYKINPSLGILRIIEFTTGNDDVFPSNV
jgi:hypothetical protein